MSDQYYGFYSQQHAESNGTFIYSTPSGDRVQVTCIDRNPEAPDYVWPDKVCVGEVSEFVDRIETGNAISKIDFPIDQIDLIDSGFTLQAEPIDLQKLLTDTDDE